MDHAILCKTIYKVATDTCKHEIAKKLIYPKILTKTSLQFINPSLFYFIPNWTHASNSTFQPLVKLENKAVGPTANITSLNHVL